MKKKLLFAPLVLLLIGCASSGASFTLKNGTTIQARKVIQETSSTYVIEEKTSGRRTVLPKHYVTSTKGL